MRTLLLGAASAVAMLAPAAASANTGGYVDLSAGRLTIESEDLDAISLGGAAAADLSQNWRVQVDGNVNRLTESGESVTLTNVEGHVYYEGQGWAGGAVLSNRDLAFGSIWSLGAEAQIDAGQVVFEGGAGFGTLEGFGDSLSSTNANVSATFYATPNFSIAAGVDYVDVHDAFGSITTYSVDAEYKFDGSSNSVFAGYDSSNYNDIGADGDGWHIGFRHAFGDDTLQGRRQTGPRWLPLKNDVAIFGFGPSDRRLKRDIAWLATLPNGMSIYAFRYTWSNTVYVGVMAQDLLAHRDWRTAVVRQANGFYAVNYAALGMRMATLADWNKNGLAAVLLQRNEDLRQAA